MEEYRDTGWYDVLCTRDGKFMRNGRKLTLRVHYTNCTPSIAVRAEGLRKKEKAANRLMAMAWVDGYKEEYNIIPIDGNEANISIENLHFADDFEFASYRAERRKNPKAGVHDLKKYGLFKQTPVQGLQCTIDGVFKRNNRIVPLYSTKRKGDSLLYIQYKDEKGKPTQTTAARLVAQTWSADSWFEDCIVQYKDGNPKNIHSDNLILVDAHKYHQLRGQVLGKGNMCDFSRAKELVERKSKEAMIACRYFQTGNMDEFNEYVRSYLTKYASDCIDKFGHKPKLKQKVLSEVLSILYEWVLCNRPLTQYSIFVKKLIRLYMLNRNYGIYDTPPKQIARNYVSQLNLDSLCERYKNTKIK